MRLQTATFGIIAIGWLALASIASAAETNLATQEQTTLSAVVDFARPLGKIRALHGVNNGPFAAGNHFADMAARHKEACFPCVRLHDSNWPNPNVVDVPAIFPLFHADPDDPKNYIFAPTDRYLEPIVQNGCQIIYRLGVSIEHKTAFYTHPPKDYQKWAKICVNIIRHYNEGWANGFHYNIKCWEIWNEPHGVSMWSGTQQQYFDLYKVAATTIKAHDSSLKVGGPAAGDVPDVLTKLFVAYCHDQKLPLDFLSWHDYTLLPQTISDRAKNSRSLLDQYGFKKTEIYCTEWRPMIAGFDEVGWQQNKPASAVREAFARNRNHEAASFAASALMLMQDSPLDMANFYTADYSPWSMFDEYGVPGKVFFAFKAFNQLTQTPNRVSVEGSPGGSATTLCAGVADDHKTAAILLSNFRGKQSQLAIAIKNLPMTGKVRVERYLVDQKHEFERVGNESFDLANPTLNITLPQATVCLLRLIQER